MALKSYYLDIYAVVQTIPQGRVTTYGTIAHFLSLASPRMVGGALNHCHSYDQDIPAHRVVNSTGYLSGAKMFEGPTVMADRLRKEGVEVKNNRVQGFKRLLWNPALEIE